MSFPPGPPIHITGLPVPQMIPSPFGVPPMGGLIPVGVMPAPMMAPVTMTLPGPPIPVPHHHPHHHHQKIQKKFNPPYAYKKFEPLNSIQVPEVARGPPVTVFVGNITERAPDNLVKQILQRCGLVINWKRVQGANGKLQAFGFCEYADPDSALRAIRLLHEYELGEKKLVVKVDAKTREKLDEYKASKVSGPPGEEDKKDEVKTEEKEEGETADEVLDSATLQKDNIIRNSLEHLIRMFASELEKPGEPKTEIPEPILVYPDPVESFDSNSPRTKAYFDKKKNELDEMDLEEDKKSLIHREIDKFRDTYKRAEEEKDRETKNDAPKDRHTRRRRDHESPDRTSRDRESDRRRETDRSRDSERSRDSDRGRDSERSRDSERTRDTDRGRDSERNRDAERNRDSERNRDVERNRDTERSRDSERSRDVERSRDSERSRDLERARDLERRRHRSRERRRESPRDSPSVNVRNHRDRSRERGSSRERVDFAREREAIDDKVKDKEDKDKDEDEDSYEKKRLERKLREKEAIYQERLRNWTTRERRKTKDYEKDKMKVDEQRKDESKEARRLKEFLEDYDDERDDVKYFKGSALVRRMKEREREIAEDIVDRQREREELDELKKKLIEEGHPNPEAEVERLLLEETRLLEQPVLQDSPESDHEERRRSPSSRHHYSFKPPSPPPPPVEEKPIRRSTDEEASQNSYGGFADVVSQQEESKPMGFTSLRLGSSPTHQNSVAPSNNHAQKRKATVDDVFNVNEEEDSDTKKKRKLVPLDDGPKSPNSVSQMSIDEKRKHIKSLIEKIPTLKDQLFAYNLDWTVVDKILMEKRIRPWINKKIVEYIGEEEPTLVEFICSKIMQGSAAQSILDDVSMVLDEEAEVFVVKMWRLLIYEIEAKKLGLVCKQENNSQETSNPDKR